MSFLLSFPVRYLVQVSPIKLRIQHRSYNLPSPSKPQLDVINSLKDEFNVKINSVAGSGKTTTILQIAQHNPQLKILAFVYNKRLQIETKEKLESLNLKNLTVQTFHGHGYSYYDKECATDQGLKRVVQMCRPPLSPISFDLLILDEQQDMTPILYLFVRKVIADNEYSNNLQYVTLGDVRQTIYNYNCASSRFLSFAEKAFPSARKWVTVEHRTSYRFTREIAIFLEKQMSMLKIDTIHTGPKPRYLICDVTKSNETLEEFEYYLSIIDPSDILILAPSIKSMNSPARYLANLITQKYENIPCYIPSTDEEGVSSDLSLGKLLFCTYHQAKGIERSAAIVFSFDKSYHMYYDRRDTYDVTNAQYVAATRAKKYLTLVHSHEFRYHSFIRPDTLNETAQVISKRVIKPKPKSAQLPTYSVTQLTSNIPDSLVTRCFTHIKCLLLNKPTMRPRHLYPPSWVIQPNGLTESVAEINGTALPALYEYHRTKRCTLLKSVKDDLKFDHRFIQIIPSHILARVKIMKPSTLELSDVLLLANVAMYLQSYYLAKLVQIKKYDWVLQKHVGLSLKNYSKHLSPKTRYEVLTYQTLSNASVRGRIDAIDGRNLFELKWTEKLMPNHVLQLVAYAALYGKRKRYLLLNGISGQLVEVLGSKENLKKVLEILLAYKSNAESEVNDEAWLEDLRNGFQDFRNVTIPKCLSSPD
ncbi:hypothetical protein NEOLI_003275 [Neolecta irregularis DAH-3]|uniref:Uncharacterized protein n=1 Tax=Neolecta irregularis (strain DAH-3) TaxID=1198029 RepID=A0A1U7LRL3_NEOID|nr:hypothetical protein NEOLI_003275 [Neolecta irregularis DAH-3]|eukprot:OLL25297.1 hypothetical protein NEOLI_003275 [Neolecta irregularis DAH-3]